ncbi:MAG TPA: enoyl-CoA hydratase-related protein [Solirubrobacterales bacterium]|nr:enoyl-CoA hydratase-related protein [Solirubrobacterales bacterium]
MTDTDDSIDAAAQTALTSEADSPVLIELIDLDGEDRVAILTLNRPEALNAITWEMIKVLERRLQAVDADPDVRAVLITGAGRAFSAGGDLKGYVELQRDPVGFPAFVDDLMRTFAGIRLMTKPVIALVNGVTVAGGLELLLGCDFAWAGASAQIGDGHLNYGQMGGGGVLSMLPRSIRPALARELLFSARLLSADEAFAFGLVNRVLPDDELLAAGIEFARDVAKKSPTAIANAKYVMNAGLADGTGVDETLRLERERNSLYCLTLPDSHEGLAAFGEKRTPVFRRHGS